MNLEKLFHLKENHTDVRTEVMAGITTFMTMAYILAVNPSILSASGMDSGAVFTATALASAIATLLMAALSNYPFVLAPGMGLNAYFAYTVVLSMGYTWEMALAAVFVEGIIFLALSMTNVREQIFNSIPMNLKYAVSAGIGLFIAFIGLQNAHIVVDSATLVVLLQGIRCKRYVLQRRHHRAAGTHRCSDHWRTFSKRHKGQHSLGHPDHLGTWYCMPADRTVPDQS